MSPPPADAVGSYGAEAIRWIENIQPISLRWWQRLAITRQLEHGADGSLCHRTIVESTPRRAGKSVRLRGLALWRMAHADLFGEVQTILHVGSDLHVCREIQRQAWRWAEVNGWTVMRANGKECIESPHGDRWLVRAQDATYGYDVCLGLVDEGWDVQPGTVTEGLEPGLLERSSPQLHLTSTAHRRATSLMRTRLTEALTTPDPETLLLLWAAPPGSDASDPEVWRAASPHWSEDRHRMIASKYMAALAGQSDPQADDPDPMRGFESQYLNVWQLRPSAARRGDALVTEEAWAWLEDVAPDTAPDSVAVEGWFSEGVSVARAWLVDAQVVVSVTDHPDLASAAAAVTDSGFRGVVTVGAGLAEDRALASLRVRPGKGRTAQAVQDLLRLLAEGSLAHTTNTHLTEQVLAVRTQPGPDGPRVISRGRADALKATAWAVASAQTKTTGKQRILLPNAG
jgi:hypothetical protein